VADVEDNDQARELKRLLCGTCYRGLIGWISGQPVEPFRPCDRCAPLAQVWLEGRQRGN
jgi:hypothetical protein